MLATLLPFVTSQGCGNVVARSPLPTNFRCGNPFAPTPSFAQRAALGGPQANLGLTQCAEKCLAIASCKTFTFIPDRYVCQLYSRGAGPNRNQKQLTPTPDTESYNIACFTRIRCFNIGVSDPTGAYNGKYVSIAEDGYGNLIARLNSTLETFFLDNDSRGALRNQGLTTDLLAEQTYRSNNPNNGMGYD